MNGTAIDSSDMKIIDSIGKQIGEAAMRAAAMKIRQQGVKPTEAQLDALMAKLREEARVAVAAILRDGKVLHETGMSGWGGTLITTESTAAGLRAYKAVFEATA